MARRPTSNNKEETNKPTRRRAKEGVRHQRSRTTEVLWPRRAAQLIRKAFLPPVPVVALAAPLIALFMAWAFLLDNKDSPLSYAAYIASAYLLVALCLWIARHAPRNGLRVVASKHPVAERALEDKSYRRKLAVAACIAVDALWAAANLIAGAHLASVWLITLGVYYALLCAMRGFLLQRMRRAGASERCDHTGVGRLCGMFLLLSTFVLSGIVCLVICGQGSFSYGDTLIYAVALFAFYSLVSAIVNYARLHGHDDMLVVLNCRVNLAAALVSVFALEVALLAEFGTAADADLQYIMPIVTGAAIAATTVAMGLHSILEAKRVEDRASKSTASCAEHDRPAKKTKHETNQPRLLSAGRFKPRHDVLGVQTRCLPNTHLHNGKADKEPERP